MEENSRGSLHQPTILTRAACASDHEFSVTLPRRPCVSVPPVGAGPKRYGHRICRHTPRLVWPLYALPNVCHFSSRTCRPSPSRTLRPTTVWYAPAHARHAGIPVQAGKDFPLSRPPFYSQLLSWHGFDRASPFFPFFT